MIRVHVEVAYTLGKVSSIRSNNNYSIGVLFYFQSYYGQYAQWFILVGGRAYAPF